MSVHELIERSAAVREEMHRALDEGKSVSDLEAHRTRKHQGSFTPMVDVIENERGFHVSLELPGVEEDDVRVKVSGNRLTVTGLKREARERRGETPFFRERCFGRFQKTILLPCAVEGEQVMACLCQGVLTVALFKVVRTPGARESEASSPTDRLCWRGGNQEVG